jgi:hypothetical protein
VSVMVIEKSQLVAAFAAWEQNYRDNPDQYLSDMERLALTSGSYGERAAAYLIELLRERVS